MNNELSTFLSEGMKKYKNAAKIMAEFYKNIKSLLQDILKNRRDWGTFKPTDVSKVRSTKYWDDYPLINAQIAGEVGGKPIMIEIAANWYSSEIDYPIYSVGFYGSDYLNDKLQAYKKHNKVELNNNSDKLLFYPNPDDFNLERDFNLLLDEFVNTFSK